MTQPLMPKATAVWLIDNTGLTFDQIADFCGLHPLEVQGIADGEVAQGIRGLDPVTNGQLVRTEIEKAEKDSAYRMALAAPPADVKPAKRTSGPRYTPVSRRQDRPDAVAWILRNHPEVADPQIAKLLGTTKPTIQSIRDRSHWNSANITPRDPVTLGLCTQIELDETIRIAAERKAKLQPAEPPMEEGPSLAPLDADAPTSPDDAPVAPDFDDAPQGGPSDDSAIEERDPDSFFNTPS